MLTRLQEKNNAFTLLVRVYIHSTFEEDSVAVPQKPRGRNQTPHVLTYEWDLNDKNTWTHGGGVDNTHWDLLEVRNGGRESIRKNS